jgi:hypothetical protein
MRAVKRWRYYCDHCKKVSGQRSAMEQHESSCTLNPQRTCKLCAFLNGGNGTPLPEMLARLPDPAQHMRTIPADEWGMEEDQVIDDEALRAATHAALPALRELTEDCPVCILAALRQRGIPVPLVTEFNFTNEMKAAQSAMNDARQEREGPYY